jgi:hypothetical protein
MKWHTVAFPAIVAAALVGCNKPGTGGETGAVPGGATTDTSLAAPAPSTTDTTMAAPAPGADSMSKSDTSSKPADSTAK